MIRVFLDANVIFSASYSNKGASFYIFQLAKKGKLRLYSSRLASAISTKAEFLLTLDKKHFFNEKVLNARLTVKIATPAQFIKNYL